ncbi:hypothetical protein SBA1_120055 [Candidatus Sulfotelmatobacter kueseliae]|uniref:Uncharacterized protein n=1 Tax=Candidatus Sulfotelmatobacter kueseliae TaxID=2042962 RepID=A0A2U3K1Z0_9BACT|nr:hypothetical protein SBA1_120055 [Candidatus Sulfotelmatobacter kueseliae]
MLHPDGTPYRQAEVDLIKRLEQAVGQLSNSSTQVFVGTAA